MPVEARTAGLLLTGQWATKTSAFRLGDVSRTDRNQAFRPFEHPTLWPDLLAWRAAFVDAPHRGGRTSTGADRTLGNMAVGDAPVVDAVLFRNRADDGSERLATPYEVTASFLALAVSATS
jgi:hypothetical protein